MRACPSLKAGGTKVRTGLRRVRWDTWSGTSYSNVTTYFITLATGVILHVSGVTDTTTAAQAASALRPLAGDSAYVLFTVGTPGAGLTDVSVLTGSGAYALSEAMGWKEGLEHKVSDARGFYSIITFSVLAGLATQYSPTRPMKAFFWSAVTNGVVVVLLMAVIILFALKPAVMGLYIVSRPLIVLGRPAAAIMEVAAMAMFLL